MKKNHDFEEDIPAGDSAMRTIVSFVLCVHLFIVAALFSYVRPSPFQQRLMPVFAPYVEELGLDIDIFPKYYLTHGSALDVDHFFELEIPDTDGGGELVRLPPRDAVHGPQYRRYQLLADVAASLAGDEESETLVPLAVARSVMNQRGVERLAVRCRAHLLQRLEDVGSADPDSAGYFKTLYDARASRIDGQVGLLKQVPRVELAQPVPGS